MYREEDEIPLLTLLPLVLRVTLSGMHKELAPYTRAQIYVFTVLAYRGSLTMKEVAGYISSTKERATRVVAPMVDDGLIERYIEPDNRSKTHIRLTDKGRELQLRLQDLIQKSVDERINTNLTQDERSELSQSVLSVVRLLGKVR